MPSGELGIALGGRRAAPERWAFFGEEFRQVGVAEIDAGLRKQGGDLAAMVNLRTYALTSIVWCGR